MLPVNINYRDINWPAIGATVGATILPKVGVGIFTNAALPKLYVKQIRPNWTPPNWVLGPVWTTLYTSMGYASYLVYRDGDGFYGSARLPLILYGSNLLVNWLWTPISYIFFGWVKRFDLAFYEMQLVNATALATTCLFHQINPIAGYLLVPYCVWLSVTTALNYTEWRGYKFHRIEFFKKYEGTSKKKCRTCMK